MAVMLLVLAEKILLPIVLRRSSRDQEGCWGTLERWGGRQGVARGVGEDGCTEGKG